MKKKIIICIYIVMLLIASRLLFTYVYNEIVIGKYNDGDYDINTKPGMMCNWIQPYIAHYNAGNIYYQNGDYKKAMAEYKLAMEKEPKHNHKCDIRINMALAMLMTLPEDYLSEENIENTKEVLTKARDVLIKDDCAKDKEAGHSDEATKLREEIDDMLNQVSQEEDPNGNGEENGGGEEGQGTDPADPQTGDSREQEIKNKLKNGQGNAYKERVDDEKFYEEIEKEYGNHFEEPVW